MNLSQCDPEEYGACDSGCNGGLMNNAFEYILQSGGVQKEKDYPYTGRDGTCKFDKTKVAATVSNYSVVSLDEEQIAANLVKNGPLAGNLIVLWTKRLGSVTYLPPFPPTKRNYRHICLIFPFFLKKKRYKTRI